MAKTKLNVGDIFEIKTPIGYAYVHYVYKDKLTGDLIESYQVLMQLG